MGFVSYFINFILHLDKNLATIIQIYGALTYGILFFIIFLETGLVVTPFLPGDSLLFVAGTLAAASALNIFPLYLLLLAAAILGDNSNYWIGRFIGPKVFAKENARLFKREYLEKTRAFYAKYGVKAIILARFMPIIRTFSPFVAGVGKMHYPRFLSYDILGGFLWISIFTWGGYFFGNLPIVKNNFHTAIFAIILLSILPGLIEYIKHRQEKGEAVVTDFNKLEETFHKQHLDQ
ncbi:DedA family protein [Candidatus Gottesmanbacteria bacterium]|nr:DedA family protein [Candidatus Gottesmanbacteria bacterium]